MSVNAWTVGPYTARKSTVTLQCFPILLPHMQAHHTMAAVLNNVNTTGTVQQQQKQALNFHKGRIHRSKGLPMPALAAAKHWEGMPSR